LPSENRLQKQRERAKEVRKEVRRRDRNREVRAATRTLVKSARVAISSGDADEALTAVKLASVKLDAAAAKGVIHRNNAGRRKSRLQQALNKMAPVKSTTKAKTSRKSATKAKSKASATPKTKTKAKSKSRAKAKSSSKKSS